MDLINREELKAYIRAWNVGEGVGDGQREFLKAVDEQPTIDAVLVVRCKDCKRWGTGFYGETDRIKCCVYARYMVGKNGYCVYGEKKDE